MATYESHTTVNTATATTVHTCAQDEELVSIRIVAQATTAAQKMQVIKRIGGSTNYALGWVEVPARSPVGGSNQAPFSTVFTAAKCYLSNTDQIQIDSENTDAFDIHVVTRDPVV